MTGDELFAEVMRRTGIDPNAPAAPRDPNAPKWSSTPNKNRL